MSDATQKQALNIFFGALKSLHDEKILINKKDFTCQIGEWLVETIYDGKRSKNGIQKGWDVEVCGKYIQVKAHSKAETNKKNRFSALKKYSDVQIDELIIIEFTFDYKLNEFYIVPWSEATKHIVVRGKKNPRSEINWSSLQDYKVDIKTLPRQDIISIFLHG